MRKLWKGVIDHAGEKARMEGEKKKKIKDVNLGNYGAPLFWGSAELLPFLVSCATIAHPIVKQVDVEFSRDLLSVRL